MVSAIGAGLASCTDEFDNHYNQSVESTGKLDITCMEYLQQNSDFSDFVTLIKDAGYETLLSSPQMYTVWAPSNDALNEVMKNRNNAEYIKNNPAYIKNIVANHIALFSYSTSSLQRRAVKMKNGKIHVFANENGGYTIGEQKLVNVGEFISQGVNNGVIYRIDADVVPYKFNILEYIGETAGLDSLKKYLYAYNDSVLDKSLSVEIGTDGNGDPVYDTIWKQENIILDKIADINVEDSIYQAAILVNNDAWIKSYEKIKAGFNFDKIANMYSDQEADSLSSYHAMYNILANNIFRTLPENITSMTSEKDSIFSTIKSSFTAPARLFGSNIIHQEQISNGTVYVTDSLPFTNEETWQPKITLSAGRTSYGYDLVQIPSPVAGQDDIETSSVAVTSYNYTITNNNGETEARFGAYITLTSLKYYPQPPRIKYYIPDVRSGKYNIYAKFRPSAMPNKLGFNLTYFEDGKKKFVEELADDSQSTIIVNKNFIYDPAENETGKILVLENFKFPHCDLLSTTDDYDKSNVRVTFDIISTVIRSERNTYSRNFHLEYIIFEPVE